MGSINLGPFAFPINPLLLLGAMLVALAGAKWAGRARPVDVEPQLWKILIAGLLGARIAFVAAYFDDYKSASLSILDIRDGGFNASAGVLAALAAAAWFVWRRRETRTPLLFSVLAGASVWGAGLLVTTLLVTTSQPEIPKMALTALDGSKVQLESMAGRPIVINLWATWCPPCRREMPVLRDGQARYPNVVFLFVNQGEPADTVRSYLNSEHLVLKNVLIDSGSRLGSQIGSRVMPTTLFFNDSGRLVGQRVGELSAATLAQQIESLYTAR